MTKTQSPKNEIEHHIEQLKRWLDAHPEKRGETADRKRARADRVDSLRRWVGLRDGLEKDGPVDMCQRTFRDLRDNMEIEAILQAADIEAQSL